MSPFYDPSLVSQFKHLMGADTARCAFVARSRPADALTRTLSLPLVGAYQSTGQASWSSQPRLAWLLSQAGIRRESPNPSRRLACRVNGSSYSRATGGQAVTREHQRSHIQRWLVPGEFFPAREDSPSPHLTPSPRSEKKRKLCPISARLHGSHTAPRHSSKVTFIW